MLNRQEKLSYEGWDIEISSMQFRPDGWREGLPHKYAITGVAELRFRRRDFVEVLNATTLRFPIEGYTAVFDDGYAGAAKAKAELIARIKAFSGDKSPS